MLLNEESPLRIRSDNGPQFISDEFEALLQNRKIIHDLSRPGNPQSNSKSERINKAFHELMRFYNYDYSEADIVQTLENRFNLVHNRSINCTPHELHFGINGLNPNITTPSDLKNKANQTTIKINEYDQRTKNKNKKEFNLNVGDLVFTDTNRNKKKETLWDGP